MRAVITGGTGFIGSHLARSLSASGWEVVTVSRHAPVEQLQGVEHHDLTVGDRGVWELIGHGDVVVHLAALGSDGISFEQPFEYGKTNAQGTLNVLEACRLAGARFVLASTQRVYAPRREPLDEDSALDPKSPYAYSKLVAETWVRMYAQLYQLPAVILRIFSVYGPGQLIKSGTSGVVSIFAQRVLAGEDLIVHGGQIRDFTYVADVTGAIESAMISECEPGSVFNIGSGVATSLADLAVVVKEAAGATSSIVIDEDYPDQSCYVAEIGKARRELGYSPRFGLREGLTNYMEWLSQK